MKVLRSLAVAFAMYSRLPVPEVEWTQESLAWSLCCFPAVGLVVGIALLLWCALCQWLSVGPLFFAAGGVLLPLLITGGIHLDGLCDVCDALGSHQGRERRLEIMHDPHIGAFGVIGCGCWLIAAFALWGEVDVMGKDRFVVALIPVLSRTLSAYAAVTLPAARRDGLLVQFTHAAQPKQCRRLLLTLALVQFGIMGLLGCGAAAAVGAVLTYFWYRTLALREFGGVTGDLAGFFLQLCELACLLGLVLVQKVVAVL